MFAVELDVLPLNLKVVAPNTCIKQIHNGEHLIITINSLYDINDHGWDLIWVTFKFYKAYKMTIVDVGYSNFFL